MSESVNSFDEMTAIARDGTVPDRVALARRSDTPPELLYFLSEDNEKAVRRAVAENPHTPRQADVVLGRTRTPASDACSPGKLSVPVSGTTNAASSGGWALPSLKP